MPAGERRRDRDDHPLGADGVAVGDDLDAVGELLDPPHGRVEDDVQGLRDELGDPLRAALEAVHLGAVLGVEVALEGARVGLVAGGGDVEEDEQQRQLARLGAEDGAGDGGDEPAEALGDRVRLDPGLERLAVVLGGLGRGPGRVDRHLGGELVQQRDRRGQLGEDRRVQRGGPGRALARVGEPGALVDVDVVAGVVGVEGARRRPRAPARGCGPGSGRRRSRRAR